MEKIDTDANTDMASASHVYENPSDLWKVNESDQENITEKNE